MTAGDRQLGRSPLTPGAREVGQVDRFEQIFVPIQGIDAVAGFAVRPTFQHLEMEERRLEGLADADVFDDWNGQWQVAAVSASGRDPLAGLGQRAVGIVANERQGQFVILGRLVMPALVVRCNNLAVHGIDPFFKRRSMTTCAANLNEALPDGSQRLDLTTSDRAKTCRPVAEDADARA